MKRLLIAFALCVLVAGCNSQKSSIKPVSLTTEYKADAFTDVREPRFSWINESDKNGAAQTSYHIRVFKDPLRPDETYWDSGIIISKESVLVPYNGIRLEPFTDYYWQVMVRDEKGEPSDWSPVCHFHTGMLGQGLWYGRWS